MATIILSIVFGKIKTGKGCVDSAIQNLYNHKPLLTLKDMCNTIDEKMKIIRWFSIACL